MLNIASRPATPSTRLRCPSGLDDQPECGVHGLGGLLGLDEHAQPARGHERDTAEIDDDTVRSLVDLRGEERDQLPGGADVDLP